MSKLQLLQEKIKWAFDKSTGENAPKRIEFSILLEFEMSFLVLAGLITTEDKTKVLAIEEKLFCAGCLT